MGLRRDLDSSTSAIAVAFGAAGLALAMLHASSSQAVFLALGVVTVGIVVAMQGMDRTGTALVLLAFVFSPMNSLRVGDSFVTISDVLFIAGFLLLAPVLVGNKLYVPLAFILGATVVIITGLLASVGSVDPHLSLNLMLRLVLATFALPVAFLLWRPSTRLLGLLGFSYMVGVSISVVNALISGSVGNTGRYTGLSTHFNYLGLSALLAASLAPFVYAAIRPSLRWLVAVAAGASLLGIWLSGSRASLLAIVLVALLYPVLERSLAAAGLLVTTATVVLLFADRVFVGNGANALARLLGGTGTSYADNAREAAIARAVDGFQQHPILGNGFVGVLEAHNIFLQVAVAVGVVGAFGYLLVLIPAAQALVSGRGILHRLGYPAVAYLVVGMFSPNLWDRMIWCVLALAYVAFVGTREDETPTQDVPAETGPALHAERHPA